MKSNRFLRKYWYVIVVVAALMVFFFPKECGNWGTSIEATYKECGCIGFKTAGFAVPAGGSSYYCYGICTDCQCVQNDLTGETRKLVPCKSGMECSASALVQPSVPIETVREQSPQSMHDIVNNGSVTVCVDYDILNSEPSVVCMACGWICSVRSPYSWKLAYEGQELHVYVWDIACGGAGLEYALEGQSESYKVQIS
jgi:hypothetical protein